MFTLIRRRVTAASDLSVHCLLRPVSPKTCDKYGSVLTDRPNWAVSLLHFQQ